MKQFLANIAQRLAPRTVANLRRLNALDPQLGSGVPQLISYERELRTLRREVDELRRENRRVAELYDVFFQWAHQNGAAEFQLLMLMQLEPSSESPTCCPKTPSPIHPHSRGS